MGGIKETAGRGPFLNSLSAPAGPLTSRDFRRVRSLSESPQWGNPPIWLAAHTCIDAPGKGTGAPIPGSRPPWRPGRPSTPEPQSLPRRPRTRPAYRPSSPTLLEEPDPVQGVFTAKSSKDPTDTPRRYGAPAPHRDATPTTDHRGDPGISGRINPQTRAATLTAQPYEPPGQCAMMDRCTSW